jgi:hypothetical protein
MKTGNVIIKLLRPHIVNGFEHPAETTLEVTQETADWLIGLKTSDGRPKAELYPKPAGKPEPK